MLSRDKILRSENKFTYFLCRDVVTYSKLRKVEGRNKFGAENVMTADKTLL